MRLLDQYRNRIECFDLGPSRVQSFGMAPSNREIAVGYLDTEVSGNVGYFLKRVKKALKQTVITELEGNLLSLVVDPEAKTVTLHQDWFACEPEVFDASTFIELIETARKRRRSK